LKNLLRRKIRTALTVLGVAVGVSIVVALVSVSKGLQTQFDRLFAAGDAHLVLTRKGAADPFISYLPDTLLDDLREAENVKAAHPFLFGAVQIPQHPFFFSFGVTEHSPLLANVRITEGRQLFDPGSPKHRIVLGRQAAGYLDCQVGSTLKLANAEYEVVGLFESGTPFIAAGGLLPFEDAQREMGLEGKMSSVMVEFAHFEPARVAEYETELESTFPVVEATVPAKFTKAFDEFALMDEGVMVLSVLAVIIGGMGVMNTMLMSVFERTREIGVLLAIGWSKAMILRQVLAEACIVCLLGGVVGIAIGVLGVEAIGGIGQFSWLSGDYGPVLLVQAMLVAVGMGLLGASYPAWRAVRVPPIEALRYV
jgi:putative ABC transport system permease protein